MPALIAIPRRTRTVIRVDWQPITKAQYWSTYSNFESDWEDETEMKMDNGKLYEVVTSRLSDSVFPLLKMVDNRLFYRAETYEEED